MKPYFPSINAINSASLLIGGLFHPTPLIKHVALSAKYDANIFLKREDMTPVRSYKIRGAYNRMSHLKNRNPIVTCSAGNHAQGVAFACNKLNIMGNIFMPKITTKQKIDKVKQLGNSNVKIFLEGNDFDESFQIAKKYSSENSNEFIHPFDDEKVIEGQGTVGLEIVQQLHGLHPDYVFLPVGGGGLAAGVSSYMRYVSPKTKVIGVQPVGAPSMFQSFKKEYIVELQTINSFVDGAAVKKPGNLNFTICRKYLDDIRLVDEGHICSKIVQMYNDDGLIIEPAGVLSLCVLDNTMVDIKGKNVVCVVSGGNSDVFRMPEILERSLIYEGLKHYFKVYFPQKAGALKDFMLKVIGPQNDIIYFKYTKIINKETGPAIIGIQTVNKEDINVILRNMESYNIHYEKLTNVSDI
jgi:threonine dehydratase